MWWLAAVPITYLVGGGVSASEVNDRWRGDGPSVSYAVEVDVAYLVRPTIGLGGHVRVSHVDGWGEFDIGTNYIRSTDFEFHTVDLGIAASRVGHSFMLQYWVGAHVAPGSLELIQEVDGMSRNELRRVTPVLFAMGGVFAFDPIKIGRNRVSVFVDLTLAVNNSHEPFVSQYSSATIGLAYRRL